MDPGICLKQAEKLFNDKTDEKDEFSELSINRKRKKSPVVTSDDSEDEMTVDINHKQPENFLDIYVEESCNLINEIDGNNDNSEEIFVPPIAAGGTINHKNERPPSEIFIKVLMKFCREAIQSGCLCLTELKEVLHMRQQEPGNILCTGVSDDLLVQSAKDSGAVEVSIKWHEPNNIPEERKRLFLYRHTGDITDKYRSVLIDLFCDSPSLRRKEIFDAFKKALNEVPSSHTYTKVISEFCQNHHGQWYLNGTYTTIQKYSNS